MVLFIIQTTKPLEPSKETMSCEYTATVTTKHGKIEEPLPKKICWYTVDHSLPTDDQQSANR